MTTTPPTIVATVKTPAHTPGSWTGEVGSDGTFAIYGRSRANGTQLLGEFYPEDMGDELPVRANLALAAAAPVMLDTLRQIAELPNYRCVAADMRKLARATLSAATGEA